MTVEFFKYYTDKALGIKRPVYQKPSLMRQIRKVVYRAGLRPKPGSIFFSPSDVFYDINVVDYIRRGIETGLNNRKVQD
jgi:hypothetical protein